MLRYKGVLYKECDRCKGTGRISGTDFGKVCPACRGFRSKEIYLLKKEDKDKRKKMLKIDELKTKLAKCYRSIHYETETRSPEYISWKREEADKTWSELKKLGVTMTLEEIQERAEKTIKKRR